MMNGIKLSNIFYKPLFLAFVLAIIPIFILGNLNDALAVDYGAYQKLLSKYVKKGKRQSIKVNLVDYKAWGRDNLHKKALGKILNQNPSRLNHTEKMAFFINAYNLLTIDLIIKEKELKSIKNLGGFLTSPWKKHSWKINGKKYSLDDIEHKVLRKMGDARIHMAINCASLSCPDLRSEPYMAKKLNAQLENQVRLFLNDKTKGMKFNKSSIEISKIFDWFIADFGGKKGIIKFISKRNNSISPKHKIKSYLKYNWDLNIK